jgi:hypothetical protein
MDDKEGYKEIPCPETSTILNFFNSYVEERKDILKDCLGSIQSNQVISLDGTYHIQKRTKVFKYIIIYIITLIYTMIIFNIFKKLNFFNLLLFKKYIIQYNIILVYTTIY